MNSNEEEPHSDVPEPLELVWREERNQSRLSAEVAENDPESEWGGGDLKGRPEGTHSLDHHRW
jgi:hypothetical protein